MHQPFSESAATPPGEDDETPAARLYQEHAAALFAYLRLHTATREEAEDLLLESFLAALEHREVLEHRSSAAQRAWLRGVAAHKIADHYRRSARRPQVTLEQVAETLYADEALSPEQAALHREEEERVRALLHRLPSLQRQVIHLRFVYDLPCAEIATVLGKRESAVRKLLWRALTLVRALYAQE
ncbi:MAG TPA: RNA polymerase sigma factor [Ktedonobacterales bacterium]|nr:RNA polymerase sigma factor [Ktedonobacterales bacterium]